MSDLLFEVTAEDVARLTDTEFQEVWAALGIVVRARVPRPVLELEPVRVALEASRIEATEPLVQVLPPRQPTAAERTAASRARGSARAGFVKGGKPGVVGGRVAEMRCPDCSATAIGGAGLSSHRRSAHPVQPPATVRVTAPVTETRPDFTARARAAADRTWRENHPDELPA